MRHSPAVFIALTTLGTVLFPFSQLPTARADITWTGDIDPVDPTTWTSDTDGYIGRSADGTLTVDDDSDLLSRSGYIGYESGSTGLVTVDGTGSTWTSSGGISVGNSGSGTLNITGGGAVTVGWDTWVSHYAGSSGTIHLDNGTLTTVGLLCAADDLTGTGTINTHGLVSDVDLFFDATHGLIQTFSINDHPSQNITVNLNVDGSSHYMGAGYSGVGTMSISDGIVVESSGGYIGYKSGSTGEVTVDGAGSTWTDSGFLTIGNLGSGTLKITGGGAVSTIASYIGYKSGSTGVVTVDRTGSTWTHFYNLYVGYSGSGTLNIADGGTVTVGTASFMSGTTFVGGGTNPQFESGGLGTIHFNNGTLTTGALIAARDDLTGTGTINTHGLVSDVNLIFDATHGLSQTFSMGDNPAQDITINLDVDGTASMGAGHSGSGTMSISDGIAVTSTYGYIGWKSGSTGAVTVDGSGATWRNHVLYVGRNGNGTLNITNGGKVSSQDSYIGESPGSTGEVTVDGAGSTWTNQVQPFSDYRSFIFVGYSGSGTLNVLNGGEVSNDYGYIGGYLALPSGMTGQVTVDGTGSTWTNNRNLYVGYSGSGTLNIQNGGLVTVAGNAKVDATATSEGTLTFGIGLSGPGLLDIEGSLTIGDNSTLLASVDSGIDLDVGDLFTVVTFDTISGAFANEPVPTLAGDYLYEWAVHYNAHDITLEVIAVVPEPAAIVLLGIGAIGLFGYRRRNQ